MGESGALPSSDKSEMVVVVMESADPKEAVVE